MRAITVREYGAVPTLTELPDPQPDPGQVLIKIHAAGMNPMDRRIAEGGMQQVMPVTFPLILGADLAGVVEAVGDGTTRFSPGDEVFGQLLIPPLGSVGTYAEQVAVNAEAPLARVPAELDPVAAAALPTAGGTAVDLVDSVLPLTGKTVLIVGAPGGVGSFATQLAVQAGAHVIASARARDADRIRAYGAIETVDYTVAPLAGTVRQAHPNGIDVLIDVASDADGFADLASLVRPGGTALTTLYVADHDALGAVGVEGVNFRVSMSGALLERLAHEVTSGRLVPPPITSIKLDDVPAILNRPGASRTEGKTVVIP
jgi:NADPH2:quinone reductase